MEVVWTDEALSDVQQIINYIASDNKKAALKVANSIFTTIDNLLTPNPHLGRLGRVKKTRELFVCQSFQTPVSYTHLTLPTILLV